MKVYIAGKITGLENYENIFLETEKTLNTLGYATMNPARMTKGFTHEEYMKVCYSMIDVCNAVYFLDNWKDSKGAVLEYEYAKEHKKIMYFADKYNE